MSFCIGHDGERARKSMSLARKLELLLWGDWIEFGCGAGVTKEDMALLTKAREQVAELRKTVEQINASMSADLALSLEAWRR